MRAPRKREYAVVLISAKNPTAMKNAVDSVRNLLEFSYEAEATLELFQNVRRGLSLDPENPGIVLLTGFKGRRL